MITDHWVLEQRGAKAPLDPRRAYAAVFEDELDARGALAPTAVVFLSNRECPFKCVMCDLWRHTLDETVPPGAIPAQIRTALAGLPPVRHIKLYNAGSFFDPAAIPPEDDEDIAAAVASFDRVIVEAHPGFLTGVHANRCLQFRDRLRRGSTFAAEAAFGAEATRLEVAIGLETAHADTLARLNKRMTIESFRRAAGMVVENHMDLRVFILLNPPFLGGEQAVEWACRSIDVAADCDASVCSVIPTRTGNGAMEALTNAVERPRLAALERVVEYGLSQRRLRVFADLWDIERFFDCACSPARAARLRAINRTQAMAAPVECSSCSPFGSWELGVGS